MSFVWKVSCSLEKPMNLKEDILEQLLLITQVEESTKNEQ